MMKVLPEGVGPIVGLINQSGKIQVKADPSTHFFRLKISFDQLTYARLPFVIFRIGGTNTGFVGDAKLSDYIPFYCIPIFQ